MGMRKELKEGWRKEGRKERRERFLREFIASHLDVRWLSWSRGTSAVLRLRGGSMILVLSEDRTCHRGGTG